MSTRQFQLAIAIAAYPLGMLIGAPILGYLSDRLGRRKLILIAISAGALMSIASGFAIAAGSLFLLLICRFVAGLFAGNMALARAGAADLSGPDKRFVYISIIALAANGGFVISPLLGGFAGSSEPAMPFIVIGVLCLVAAAVVAWLLPETEHGVGGNAADKHEQAPPSGIKAAIQTVRSSYVRDAVLAYLALIVGWNIFFQITRRFPRSLIHPTITVGGLVVMIPTVLVFGFSYNAVLAWVMVVPLAMGSALASAGIATRGSELVSDRSQGTVSGAFGAMTAIGWTTGPLLAAVGSLVGLSFTFSLAAIAFVLSIFLFQRTRRPDVV